MEPLFECYEIIAMGDSFFGFYSIIEGCYVFTIYGLLLFLECFWIIEVRLDPISGCNDIAVKGGY